MPGSFSPAPQVGNPDMHHGTCVTHAPWCMPGSLTSSFLWSRWRRKTFPAFPVHAQPTVYISDKRPIHFPHFMHVIRKSNQWHLLLQYDDTSMQRIPWVSWHNSQQWRRVHTPEWMLITGCWHEVQDFENDIGKNGKHSWYTPDAEYISQVFWRRSNSNRCFDTPRDLTRDPVSLKSESSHVSKKLVFHYCTPRRNVVSEEGDASTRVWQIRWHLVIIYAKYNTLLYRYIFFLSIQLIISIRMF